MRAKPILPSLDKPVVWDGDEMKSIYLTGHATDEQLRDMNEEGIGGFAQAAVKIISDVLSDVRGGGPSELYWGDGQILYLKDGTQVADGLAQAAKIAKELNWSDGTSINWRNVKPANFHQDVYAASKALGFIKANKLN